MSFYTHKFLVGFVSSLVVLFFSAGIEAQEVAEGESSVSDSSPVVDKRQFFFDADTQKFSKDGMAQIFDGNVVVVGSGLIIAADKIQMDRRKQVFEATGNVIVATKAQVFTGTKLVYQLGTSDFEITDTTMINSDFLKAETLTQEILGISAQEVWFESEKAKRFTAIAERKSRIIQEHKKSFKKNGDIREDLLEMYALALEQEQISKDQENPALAKMSPERRENYKNRRVFWSKAQKSAQNAKGMGAYYFRLDGDSLVRTDGNDFLARNSLFSPCKCAEGESPAWGFRADKIEMQIGGYADFYNPVLEVKGIPVLYLPYLKMPVKDQRQSGFLMPSFTNDPGVSGNIYSQPVYFDFGKNLDATVTTEFFEKRGSKLGLELRYQQKIYSGWEINVETIRDRSWNEDRKLRENLLTDYFDDTPYCTQSDFVERAACNERIRNRLSVPGNTWRGSRSWKGLSILQPRISFVSSGELLSDHRYMKDLRVADSFQDALNNVSQANMYSTINGRVHYDGPSLYASAYSAFGDNVLLQKSFQGYQMPASAVVQTRMFEVIPETKFTKPFYSQLLLDHMSLYENSPNFRDPNTGQRQIQSLGDGQWQRAKVDVVSPILSETALQLDHFTDFEARRISYSSFAPKDSTINSLRTGFNFNLPIDGMMKMPTWISGKNPEDLDTATRYFHHIMNWSLTLSARPFVIRRGPYGDLKDPNGVDYLFQGSDRKYYIGDNDDLVSAADAMQMHQMVSFGTSHSWRAFSRNWVLLSSGASKAKESSEKDPKNKKVEEKKVIEQETYRDRARRELMESLDQSLTSVQDVVDPENPNRIFAKQYKKNDFNIVEPLQMNAGISYDYVKAKLRREAIANSQKDGLPEPWSEPTVAVRANAFGYSLTTDVRYNLYKNFIPASNSTLYFPSFYNTSLMLGYAVLKEAYESDGTITFKLTNTRSISLGTTIIPYFNIVGRLEQKRGDIPSDNEDLYYRSVLAVSYISPSECWGLNFARTKEFGIDERLAGYTLQLSVLFGGQNRAYSGLEKSILREVKSDEAS